MLGKYFHFYFHNIYKKYSLVISLENPNQGFQEKVAKGRGNPKDNEIPSSNHI